MKESYYLKHDYDARNDERIVKLRHKYPDGSGYGIYWMIVEKLAQSSEGRLELKNIDSLAFDLHLESERIADVVHSYELFEVDDKYFWSNRLLSDFAEREMKSKKAILANKIRWDRERKKLQMDSKRNPNGLQGEDRIGEKKKEKESIKEKDKFFFAMFWRHFPKKKGKLNAFKVFVKVMKTGVKVETLIAAIEKLKQSEEWRRDGGKFIPHPATWLNSGGWDDQVEIDVEHTDEFYIQEIRRLNPTGFSNKYGSAMMQKYVKDFFN